MMTKWGLSASLQDKKKKEGGLGGGFLHQCHSQGTLSLRICQLGIQRGCSAMYCCASAGLYLQIDLFALHSKLICSYKKNLFCMWMLSTSAKTSLCFCSFFHLSGRWVPLGFHFARRQPSRLHCKSSPLSLGLASAAIKRLTEWGQDCTSELDQASGLC